MKILLYLLLITCTKCLFGQVLDGSFEKWDTAYHWVLPVNSQYELVPQVWKSNNEIHPDWHPFLVSTPASQSLESPFNDFSLKLESIASIGIDEGGPGILFQDIPLESIFEISYWMKCDSLAETSGCIVEVFGIDEELKLIYQDSISKQHAAFQKYTISYSDLNPFNYDSIRLQFRAVGYVGLTDKPLGYTRMLIDEVEANYLSSSSELNETNAKLYPNPATSHLTVESLNQLISTIDLMDSNGRKLKSKNCQNNTCELELTDQPNGEYFVKIKFDDEITEIKRFIKYNP